MELPSYPPVKSGQLYFLLQQSMTGGMWLRITFSPTVACATGSSETSSRNISEPFGRTAEQFNDLLRSSAKLVVPDQHNLQ